MKRVYQCCYTNLSQENGGVVSSGWNSLAVSKDIPYEAYTSCIRFQGVNSMIQGPMTDERGKVLNLLEFIGDGNYIFAMRTQYGLLDRLGRPNMFSQAYIFPTSEREALMDPNVFLTIDNSCFHGDVEAAEAEDVIRNTGSFTLETAMAEAGLTWETYLKLIQCVYTQFSDKQIHKPLFLQYNGEEHQMRAILYCVYVGVPYFVRRRLHSASCDTNSPAGKNIIFSEFADQHDYFLDLRTGENSILSPRAERRIARFGFVDFAVRQGKGFDADSYFFRLEQTAIALGDSTASSELVLKIAHRILFSPVNQITSDTELEEQISDALRAGAAGSGEMEKYIASLLEEVCRRKLVLTAESETELADQLSTAATQELQQAGEKYEIFRFSGLSIQEACQRLASMTPVMFERYSRKLVGSPEGEEILDLFYSNELADEPSVSWESLNEILTETDLWSVRPLIEEVVKAQARRLYCTSIAGMPEGGAVLQYQQFCRLMTRLRSAPEQYEILAKEEYWRQFSFRSITLDQEAEYKFMATPNAPRCMILCQYFPLLKDLKDQGFSRFLEELNLFFASQEQQGNISAEDAADLQKNACAQAERFNPQEPRQDMEDWIRLAHLVKRTATFQTIMEMRSCITQADSPALFSAYSAFEQECCLEIDNGPQILRSIDLMIIRFLNRQDSPQNPIPLDYWLTIGFREFKRGFDIFDQNRAEILHVDAEEVVSQSKLLQQDRIIYAAESYVQEKGAEAKVVKSWLNTVRSQYRRKNIEQKITDILSFSIYRDKPHQYKQEDSREKRKERKQDK